MKTSSNAQMNGLLSGIAIGLLLAIAPWIFDERLSFQKVLGPYLLRSSWFDSSNGNWLLATLIGVVVGALATSAINGRFSLRISDSEHGNQLTGILMCVAGGFVVMCGLLISGDSLWGHLESATKLSVGAWLFLATALFTTFIISRIGGGRRGDGAEKPAGKTKAKSKGRKRK